MDDLTLGFLPHGAAPRGAYSRDEILQLMAELDGSMFEIEQILAELAFAVRQSLAKPALR